MSAQTFCTPVAQRWREERKRRILQRQRSEIRDQRANEPTTGESQPTDHRHKWGFVNSCNVLCRGNHVFSQRNKTYIRGNTPQHHYLTERTVLNYSMHRLSEVKMCIIYSQISTNLKCLHAFNVT